MVLFRWLRVLAGLPAKHRRAPARRRWDCHLLLEDLKERIVPSFLPAVNYPAGGFATIALTADQNGDGAADLVTGNAGTGSLTVFLNQGDGTFLPGVQYAVASGVITVGLEDVNGDGIFGDAYGANPTLLWFNLGVLGINNGPRTLSVSVRAFDGSGGAFTWDQVLPLKFSSSGENAGVPRPVTPIDQASSRVTNSGSLTMPRTVTPVG